MKRLYLYRLKALVFQYSYHVQLLVEDALLVPIVRNDRPAQSYLSPLTLVVNLEI
jgi:hypothetical protein